MRVYHDFFCYPDPDPRFLKWIPIRNTDIYNRTHDIVYTLNQFPERNPELSIKNLLFH